MKIMRSDFCKIVPEMITSIVAAGNYAIQVPVLVERQLLHPNICYLEVISEHKSGKRLQMLE
ncbi:hypothetical protein HanXRQr2_Chr10g0458821 [Helianthus annuus]|uniref:Uncharacterized protein n=1 Tax=Helianthus annuus TaxID=4232 RepID=A0A9K3N5X9_HELAN|nr:hypothetical protein HanXRQr2_Chr10g0458821 [Helianthus annuus]